MTDCVRESAESDAEIHKHRSNCAGRPSRGDCIQLFLRRLRHVHGGEVLFIIHSIAGDDKARPNIEDRSILIGELAVLLEVDTYLRWRLKVQPKAKRAEAFGTN